MFNDNYLNNNLIKIILYLIVFNKSSKSMVDNSWTISQIVERCPPEDWKTLFEENKENFAEISEDLENHQKKYGPFVPCKKDIFNAYRWTPPNTIKVVIIGQDPYPHMTNIEGELMPRAIGLSFSVRKQDYIPVSLQNIFLELKRSIPEYKMPKHGDLSHWTKQGVFLLNSCLTVDINNPRSHNLIWMGFIKKTIKFIDDFNPQCIYVLWGKDAQKINSLLSSSNTVLESPHPASRTTNFIGNNHFVEINRLLKLQEKEPIDWQT